VILLSPSHVVKQSTHIGALRIVRCKFVSSAFCSVFILSLFSVLWFNNFRCVKHLQKQEMPTGVEFEDDEFILHVEGTASSQRVVRHIGGESWPGL